MADSSAPPNFRELLSQPTDTVDRPKALATGHYHGKIINHEFGASSKKGTPFVRFFVLPTAPGPDIDEAAMAGVDLSRRELRIDYYITPKSLYRLSDMLDAVLGKQAGRSFDERIPETRDASVQIGVGPRNNEDGTDSGYNEITSLVADV